MAEGGSLVSVDFEIFGTVQRVFFRKYTQKKAKSLNLVGWVKNTRRYTVLGQVQGNKDAIKTMKHWLSSEGSPSSTIDKAEFKDEKTINKVGYKTFSVKR